MTFKEFEKWCEERICDGCWGLKEAILCMEVLDYVKAHPFWARKKAWNDFRDRVVTQIVEPTNRKIQELRGD